MHSGDDLEDLCIGLICNLQPRRDGLVITNRPRLTPLSILVILIKTSVDSVTAYRPNFVAQRH